MKNILVPIFQGICIGIGNIIPGVSGGTIALILGIYEKLIKILNNINLDFFLLPLYFFKKEKEKTKKILEIIEIKFIIPLLIGVVLGIFCLSFLISYTLEYYHTQTYSFFWGLILFSVIVPYRLIKKFGFKEIISCFLGIILVVGISLIKEYKEREAVKILKKQEKRLNNFKNINLKKKEILKLKEIIEKKNKNLTLNFKKGIFYFVAGIIAICAMILPGISGSFILLLMGGYFEILKAIKELNLLILGIFGIGTVIGILIFSRFLNYILNKYYNITMAFLMGLIIGSLYSIWPFKEVVQILGNNFYLNNTLPSLKEVINNIIPFVIGGILVIFMSFKEKIN